MARLTPRNCAGAAIRRESLLLSTAVVALACTTFSARSAKAQTVTSTGAVMPAPVQSPVWTIGAPLVVGDGSDGTLTIANGGSVSSTLGEIANGAAGSVTVSGTDGSGHASTWDNSSDILVGQSGTGLLTVENGGMVNTDGELFIGYDGTGTLNITSGGKVVSNLGTIGADASEGQVLVTGPGSSWDASGRITVGLFSNGTLHIEDGATVSSSDALIGAAAHGDVVVSGSGSSWTAATQFTVGSFGTGTLLIENGGNVTSNQGYIGANADGSAVVTGAGSSWLITDFSLTIGNEANGTLSIEDGGLVRAVGGVFLGADVGTSGTLSLQGTAANPAVLETAGFAAGLGAANVTIDGGLVRAIQDNDVFFDGFDTHDITLGTNGGVIDTNGYDIDISPRFVGVGSLVKAGAGTLTLTGANIYTGGTTINAGALQLGNGGTSGSIVGDVTNNGSLIFDRSDDIGFGGLVSGTGSLVKNGAGTLVLTGANSYAGATSVNAGTLRVDGDQSAATGPTTVFSGATLGGSGIIGGSVDVRDGGILAPGGSPSTLTINGNLSLAAGSILDYQFGQANVAGGALNDLVNVGGNLTLAGTLNVTVPAGGSFGAGIYRVFNYDGTLTDDGLALGTMPAGSTVFVQTSIAHQVNLVNTNASRSISGTATPGRSSTMPSTAATACGRTAGATSTGPT